MSNAKDVKL